MEDININKLISEYIFNINDSSERNQNIEPIEITKNVINYCKNLENDLDENKLVKILSTIDTLYKSVGLMKIVSNDDKFNLCDIELEKYITMLFSNKKIYKKMKQIKNTNSNNLLDIIFKNFVEGKNENLQKINLEMNKIKLKIELKLNDGVVIQKNNEIKQILNDKSNTSTIFANPETCINLQKKIKDANLRKQIEDVTNSKTQKILDDFAILLLYRDKYSKLLGHDSYFEYVKQKGTVDSIKNLINDLLNKIEQRSKKETERLKREMIKDGFNKKVDGSDFIYYYEKYKPLYLFKPVEIIKIIFDISEKMFGITFKPAKFNLNLWSEKIMTCKVMGVAKEDLGFVHFDLYKTSTKKINNPLCVKLSGQPKRICLLTSYHDINSKCMTFSDVILLFREFGCVLQMITHNKDELIVKNDEFDILMCQVMEYIVWEKSTIEKICFGLDPVSVEHITFMRYINFANTIKNKCVNSLFDHIIHNSEDLIDLIKQNTSKGLGSGEIIDSLYKKIYFDIWSEQSDTVNLTDFNINPNVILNEISGNESTLYCNILTEILSFSVYTLIKDGFGKDFIKDVLSKPSNLLRESLNIFIGKLKSDSYYLYLQEVIGYNEINTETNMKIKKMSNTNQILTETSGNYFDDGDEIYSDEYDSDSDSHENKDNIRFLNKNKTK